ncbi:fibrinogen alpha chain-like [Sardina pilchardus]|uniref:fibrinogen alpha chain-like n=1 Tax=Sardina pilchardus TaxID=27697 RepID=UPI002E0DE0F5
MKPQQVIRLCLLLATAWTASFAQIDPRGNRPVEHGHKADKCASEKTWPFCTDDDWGPKCPSGCRIQGLLDKTDNDLLTRIDKIRRLLDDNRQKYRSTDQSSKQTYDYLRDRLTSSSGNDNKYMSLAESLRQRIVEVKIKIDRQLNILEALKARVREQVIEMQRLEVDIDMKLRNCKGSCAEYAEFSADRESYVAIDKQLDQLESIRVNSVERVGALRVMKSRPLKEVIVPSIYKSGLGAEDQKQYFGDVGQAELTLQAEGATADAPATVSKFPSTDSSSSSSSTSRVTSTTLKCTRTVRKVVTHTKDGPVEKFEEVLSGEGCDAMGGGDRSSLTSLTSQGGFGDSFTDPFKMAGGFGSGGSTKTMGSTKTVSSTKSLLSGTKGSAFGDDFGAFGRGDVDDDLPDIFARSGRPGTQSAGEMEKIPTDVE